MKIVVIGGTGLIGSRTVTLLHKAGHEVVSASPASGIDILTGEGLSEAFSDAEVVVDVSNSPSFEPNAVLDFFETAGRNILEAERTAGIRHHVALSIVGTDRMPDNGYFRAKMAQEQLIENSGIPFTIVRATQFMEFIGAIANTSVADDGKIHLPDGLFQPIAADDVAAVLAETATTEPRNVRVEIAGPDRAAFHHIVARYFQETGDGRDVVCDPQARYFGGTVVETSLVPIGDSRIGDISLDNWLRDFSPA